MEFLTESEKEKTSQYWKNIKPGSQIVLKDPQSIELGVYMGTGSGGVGYKAVEVDRLDLLDSTGNISGVCQWIFAKLVRIGADDLFLMAKSVSGQETECRVYYKPQVTEDSGNKIDLVPSGNRLNLINEGHSWIFPGMEDEIGFKLHKLFYTQDIKYAADGENETIYIQKPTGEMFARCIQNPSFNNNSEELVATIVEYKAESETMNPEGLFIEIGNVDNSFGGNITLYFGTEINLDEIDVLNF